jgi:serine/threonine protein kinase
MAPEVLSKENKQATSKLDIFALGIIFYKILFNEHPLYNGGHADECKDAIINGELIFPEQNKEKTGKWISEDAIDLLKGMLEKDPEK